MFQDHKLVWFQVPPYGLSTFAIFLLIWLPRWQCHLGFISFFSYVDGKKQISHVLKCIKRLLTLSLTGCKDVAYSTFHEINGGHL